MINKQIRKRYKMLITKDNVKDITSSSTLSALSATVRSTTSPYVDFSKYITAKNNKMNSIPSEILILAYAVKIWKGDSEIKQVNIELWYKHIEYYLNRFPTSTSIERIYRDEADFAFIWRLIPDRVKKRDSKNRMYILPIDIIYAVDNKLNSSFDQMKEPYKVKLIELKEFILASDTEFFKQKVEAKEVSKYPFLEKAFAKPSAVDLALFKDIISYTSSEEEIISLLLIEYEDDIKLTDNERKYIYERFLEIITTF